MTFDSNQEKEALFAKEAIPHLDALYTSAVYMTRDKRHAEDLVQDTFLKAFRSFHTYTPGTNCRSWLHRILRNTFINSIRGKKREFSYIENIDVQGADTNSIDEYSSFYKNPEQGYLFGMMHEEVMGALKALPPHFRTVVVLADIQDFSYKEIAEVEDCPIGTVMSRLHRGRKMLQRRLRNYARETGILPQAEESDDPVPPAASLDEYRQKRVKEGK